MNEVGENGVCVLKITLLKDPVEYTYIWFIFNLFIDWFSLHGHVHS